MEDLLLRLVQDVLSHIDSNLAYLEFDGPNAVEEHPHQDVAHLQECDQEEIQEDQKIHFLGGEIHHGVKEVAVLFLVRMCDHGEGGDRREDGVVAEVH